MFGRSFGVTSPCIAKLLTLKFSPRTHLDVGFLMMVAVCEATYPSGALMFLLISTPVTWGLVSVDWASPSTVLVLFNKQWSSSKFMCRAGLFLFESRYLYSWAILVFTGGSNL
ncbi:hypothetical protein TIFTF001_000945 [Ficus carica]|uniref:Uncharacterized protein n=1 Tax=Ficus carica TaxID=3494 RepID=A0AA87Z6K8_FICCA|nr:hypothetical protein TIFTF001_000945 [Ficus carica]